MSSFKHLELLLALAAADDLADHRRQHIHRRDGAAVVVHPRVEGFDRLRQAAPHRSVAAAVTLMRDLQCLLSGRIALIIVIVAACGVAGSSSAASIATFFVSSPLLAVKAFSSTMLHLLQFTLLAAAKCAS